MNDDLDEPVLDALNAMNDDDLVQFYDDIPDDGDDMLPLVGYGRPATRRPLVLDPHRGVDTLPALDTYLPNGGHHV